MKDIITPICWDEACIITWIVSSPDTWGSLREEKGGDGHLPLVVLFVGVGLTVLGYC